MNRDRKLRNAKKKEKTLSKNQKLMMQVKNDILYGGIETSSRGKIDRERERAKEMTEEQSKSKWKFEREREKQNGKDEEIGWLLLLLFAVIGI